MYHEDFSAEDSLPFSWCLKKKSEWFEKIRMMVNLLFDNDYRVLIGIGISFGHF